MRGARRNLFISGAGCVVNRGDARSKISPFPPFPAASFPLVAQRCPRCKRSTTSGSAEGAAAQVVLDFKLTPSLENGPQVRPKNWRNISLLGA